MQGAIVGRWREESQTRRRRRHHRQPRPTCCCFGTVGASWSRSSSLCRGHFLEELILIRGHRVRPGSSTVAGARTRSPEEPSEGSGSAVGHRPSSLAPCRYIGAPGCDLRRGCRPRNTHHVGPGSLGDGRSSCGACSLVHSPVECCPARCRHRTGTPEKNTHTLGRMLYHLVSVLSVSISL